jgi:hypothetical protein
MNKIAGCMFAAALACGPGPCFAQQEKNPNQQQQQDSPKNQPPPDNPGQNAPASGKANPDIPQQKPGTNNPDIGPDSKPAAGSTAPEASAKKRRNRKSTSSTHTAPTV